MLTIAKWQNNNWLPDYSDAYLSYQISDQEISWYEVSTPYTEKGIYVFNRNGYMAFNVKSSAVYHSQRPALHANENRLFLFIAVWIAIQDKMQRSPLQEAVIIVPAGRTFWKKIQRYSTILCAHELIPFHKSAIDTNLSTSLKYWWPSSPSMEVKAKTLAHLIISNGASYGGHWAYEAAYHQRPALKESEDSNKHCYSV